MNLGMLLLKGGGHCYSPELKIQGDPKLQPHCLSQVTFLENTAAPGVAVPFKACLHDNLKAAMS